MLSILFYHLLCICLRWNSLLFWREMWPYDFVPPVKWNQNSMCHFQTYILGICVWLLTLFFFFFPMWTHVIQSVLWNTRLFRLVLFRGWHRVKSQVNMWWICKLRKKCLSFFFKPLRLWSYWILHHHSLSWLA